MTNILLLGNGAREHIIAKVLRKNPEVILFSFMKTNNPGISKLSTKIKLGNILDTTEVLEFARDNNCEIAIIGPEAPLEVGIVDELEKAGIGCIGPKKILAQLETSKSFTRALMNRYKIPGNPNYKIFKNNTGIRQYLEELKEYVIKADGLLGGKGVKVSGDHLKNIDEGVKYAEECLIRDGTVIIEDKLIGEEFSLQCFSDGETVKPCPPVQDHKRAYVDDTGPNTGGMGSYSDSDHLLPFLTQADVDDALVITKQIAQALKEETKFAYNGILYGGFIATEDGVKLIEYNARFGDPEVLNVLSLLKTDLLTICKAIISGTLKNLKVEFENKATVCKYVVPDGYPDNPVENQKVDPGISDAQIYYAAVDAKEDGLYMTTSRALAYIGIADTIENAEKIAENGIKNAKGRIFHREDIGTKDLINKRIKHMELLRQ